jgi:hypothetical protein
MKVKLRAQDPHQGCKLELNNVILETKVSQNGSVKFSPFGSHASELMQQLHPLCNCGLSRITRKGSEFLHGCRGKSLSFSLWARFSVFLGQIPQHCGGSNDIPETLFLSIGISRTFIAIAYSIVRVCVFVK